LGTVRLDEIVHQIGESIAPEAGQRNIEWRIAELPVVAGDASMLRLAFANLISNAVKFTRDTERAVIEIGWTDDEPGAYSFFVRDNGAGFDPTYKDKLFGVFQRLHSDKEFEGTGIGLANVQRIIHRHGGRVWADAAVGRGASFWFTLPKVGY